MLDLQTLPSSFLSQNGIFMPASDLSSEIVFWIFSLIVVKCCRPAIFKKDKQLKYIIRIKDSLRKNNSLEPNNEIPYITGHMNYISDKDEL